MRELERQNCDSAILVDPRAKWVSDVSSDLLKLSRWCTDYDSHNRPSMTIVSWFSAYFQIIKTICCTYVTGCFYTKHVDERSSFSF